METNQPEVKDTRSYTTLSLCPHIGTYLSPEFVTNFMISWRKLESPKNGISIEPHFFHIWLFRGSLSYFFCNSKSHLESLALLMKCVPIMKIADIILPFLELPLGLEK
jgi:hypothetical protein